MGGSSQSSEHSREQPTRKKGHTGERKKSLGKTPEEKDTGKGFKNTFLKGRRTDPQGCEGRKKLEKKTAWKGLGGRTGQKMMIEKTKRGSSTTGPRERPW